MKKLLIGVMVAALFIPDAQAKSKKNKNRKNSVTQNINTVGQNKKPTYAQVEAQGISPSTAPFEHRPLPSTNQPSIYGEKAEDARKRIADARQFWQNQEKQGLQDQNNQSGLRRSQSDSNINYGNGFQMSQAVQNNQPGLSRFQSDSNINYENGYPMSQPTSYGPNNQQEHDPSGWNFNRSPKENGFNNQNNGFQENGYPMPQPQGNNFGNNSQYGSYQMPQPVANSSYRPGQQYPTPQQNYENLPAGGMQTGGYYNNNTSYNSNSNSQLAY